MQFLRLLTEDELQRLRRQVVFRRFRKGQVVFHQGDESDGFYTVWNGCVAVSVSEADGGGRLLQMVARGESIGEVSMLEGRVRPVTATAREASTLAFLSRRDFQELLTARPELSVAIVSMLSANFGRLRAKFADSVALDVPTRLAKLMLELQQRHAAPDIELKKRSLRFSQRELAEMLSVSRVWVSRELNRWRGAGIVELRRGRLIVCDHAALARLANAKDLSPDTV